MAITVLFSIKLYRFSCIAASTSESSALVASSSNKIGAFFKITRAIAMRWRWPPESLTPRSPTCASKPRRPCESTNWSRNSPTCACFNAACKSASLASGRPYKMLSRTERCSKEVSCVTMPMCWRSDTWLTWAMFCPSMLMSPPLMSYKRSSKFTKVDLPAPERPTKPIFSPPRMFKLNCLSNCLCS